MTAPDPRIIHVATGREWRGGQRQVLLLAQGLRRAGLEQVVVTTRASRLAAELEGAGIPTMPVGWDRGVSLSALAAVWRATGSAPALLHAHDGHAIILAGLVARVARHPFVATRRVDLPIRRPGFWARADRVVAISAAVRAALIARGIEPARIDVVASGIDLARTAATEAGTVRADYRLPADRPLVVSIGSLEPSKGPLTVLDAAIRLADRQPEIHWAFAGAGPLGGALAGRARDAGLAERVHILGAIADPLRLIRAADLLVMASTSEGLGTSILDALALGVPVVASQVGGIPEVIGPDAGILVAPGDGAAFATAIQRVLGDAGLAARLRAAGLERVRRFSADEMTAGVLRVYRSVALVR